MRTLLLLTATALTLLAQSAEEIVRKVDAQMRGESAHMILSMIVKTPEWERTIRLESWGVGEEKSFIHILDPRKDRGITFLKLDDEMWQYVPRIEKVLKIPPSMMLQSWMGSDFTNDDLVKESSLIKDYTHRLDSEDDTTWALTLQPKEEAAVVWGKLTMTVDKATYLPRLVEYYDEEGTKIRRLFYEEYRQINGRWISYRWRLEPLDPEQIEYDIPINNAYFTKRALKQFSRR